MTPTEKFRETIDHRLFTEGYSVDSHLPTCVKLVETLPDVEVDFNQHNQVILMSGPIRLTVTRYGKFTGTVTV